MRYYRDVDYYLYFEEFPKMGVYGVACANTNGTVNIYINTLYSEEIQFKTIKHELAHMAKGHIWDDIKLITQKELEASDNSDCSFGDVFAYVDYEPPKPFIDILEHPRQGFLPVFHSLESLLHYYEQAAIEVRKAKRQGDMQ